MASLAERRALLTAALGFARLRWREPQPPAARALDAWLTSWAGVGAVLAGMTAQGFNVELKEFPYGWRASFYAAGLAHSVVLASAYRPTPSAAVQGAAWEALTARREEDGRPGR